MNKFYKYNIDKAKKYLLEMYFGTDNPSIQDLLDVGMCSSSVAFNFIEFCAMQKAKGKKYIYIKKLSAPCLCQINMDSEIDMSRPELYDEVTLSTILVMILNNYLNESVTTQDILTPCLIILLEGTWI